MSAKNTRTINIAVLALGGQGGGVLVDWLVSLAEHQGWTAQSTSIAGVAQRTGATVYYIEFLEPHDGTRTPVLAQMPVMGDVDIVICSELMEAGRAVQRGFVTPEKTTVITSTHRTFSVDEKSHPSNGIADAQSVLDIVQAQSKHLIAHDMQQLALDNGSVISSSLFGALAGAKVLPFDKNAFEHIVIESGVGIKASLRAFNAAYLIAEQDLKNEATQPQGSTDDLLTDAVSMISAARELPQSHENPAINKLLIQIRREFPRSAWNILGEGLARVIDYQDINYGVTYLNHVGLIAVLDKMGENKLTYEAAHWIAVAMSYDDVMRVADLKTRAERFTRIRSEISAAAHEVNGIEEYLHPRLEEVLGILPTGIATRLMHSKWVQRLGKRLFSQGQRIHTTSVWGFIKLRCIARLRAWRLISLRHREEMQHMQHWLNQVVRLAPEHYDLAVELLRARRLVKGYSDTHARGMSKFDNLMQSAEHLVGRQDAAQQLASLLQIALKDTSGSALTTARQSLKV